jgi:hypothetical protein
VMEDDKEVDNSEEPKTTVDSRQNISVVTCFLLVGALLGLYYLVYTTDSQLPSPLDSSDEQTHVDAFITERARRDLKMLTDLGPREAGNYTSEVLAVDLLKRIINNITETAHKNQLLELDLQIIRTNYSLKFTNIVVKLYGSGNASRNVLINSHFDSVPDGPGASDDGINCAVMLEILRKLSRQPHRPSNNLIFLFNGAEESGLFGSYMFVKQHRWARNCTVVVNLEAVGSGGKLILFQATPWLLKYYSRVPHPYAQSIAEEIYVNGIIPSGTDFTVFKYLGHMIGVDMAFFKNGERYHTKDDNFENIPPGSFQHAGDNTLVLVRQLANAPEVMDPKTSSDEVIYFDFLGLFLVSYAATTGYIMNIIVSLASFATYGLSIYIFKLGSCKQTIKCLSLSFGVIIGGWIIAAIFVVSIAIFLNAVEYDMSWYSNPWILFGLYVAPIIGLSSAILTCVKYKYLTHNVKSQIEAHSVRIIWTGLLLTGTILNIKAMYVLLIYVLFNTIGFLTIYIFKLQNSRRKWQIIYVTSLIIPTIFSMYVALLTFCLFIPTARRINLMTNINTELLLGPLTLLFTTLIMSPLVALANLVDKFKYVLWVFAAIFVLSFLLVFTLLPYNF